MLMTCTDAIPFIQPSRLPGMSNFPSFLPNPGHDNQGMYERFIGEKSMDRGPIASVSCNKDVSQIPPPPSKPQGLVILAGSSSLKRSSSATRTATDMLAQASAKNISTGSSNLHQALACTKCRIKHILTWSFSTGAGQYTFRRP